MKRYTKPGILIVELASEVIMNTGSISDGTISLESIPGGEGGKASDDGTVWGDARQYRHHCTGFDVWDTWD